jgi:hypothetical protein
MFIRVLRLMSGHVDGIDLCRFEAGRIYRLPHALAAFVLAIHAGEPVDASVDFADCVWKGVLRQMRPPTHYTGGERRLVAR